MKNLDRQTVIDVIERKNRSVHPLVFHKWWGEGLFEKYGESLNEIANKYPDDIFKAGHLHPGFDKSTNDNPEYRWGFKADYSKSEKHSIGETIVLLDDWNDLELFLESIPSPYEKGIFDRVKKALPQANGRYKLGYWWNLFHERFWTIRGMENLMMDYYDNMEGLKTIGKHLVEYYKGIIDQYADLGFDGIFASDDLGHQTGPMMSPGVFRELYFPLYRDFCTYAHQKGLHVFLHSCGDNTLLLDDLVEAGLDVIHPIQAGCMDYRQVAEKYRDKITFLLGIDVQNLLPYGSLEEVENGIKNMINIFEEKNASFLIASGNGIMPDTPLENIDLMLNIVSSYR